LKLPTATTAATAGIVVVTRIAAPATVLALARLTAEPIASAATAHVQAVLSCVILVKAAAIVVVPSASRATAIIAATPAISVPA